MAKKDQSQKTHPDGNPRFLDPKNDVSFKKIFGEEASKPLLASFINSLLDLKGKKQVEVLELMNPQQLPIAVERKFTIIDILCKDQRDHRYVIEMQLSQHAGFEKRAQLYSSGCYVRQHLEGKLYTNLNPVVFLGILNYNAFPADEDCKTEHLVLSKKTYKHYLQAIKYFFVELPKFTKELSELKTVEDKWLYFLKHAPEEKEIPDVLAQEKPIADAYGVLERYKWNEEQLLAYEHARLDDEVLIAQKQEGIQQVAKNMLEEGMDLKVIIKMTGLTQEQLLALKNEKDVEEEKEDQE